MTRPAFVTLLLLAISFSWPAARAEVPAGTRADMFSESQYAVQVDTFADRQQVRPGEQFTLAARIIPFENDEIKFHIYGAEPSEDWSYLPSVMTMTAADDVEWGEVIFPPGERHDTQMWLLGQPVVTVTGELAADALVGPRWFEATLMFGACTADLCLVPSEVVLSWEIEIVAADFAGEIAVLDMAQLHAPVEIDYGRFSLPAMEGELGGGIDLGGDEPAGAEGGAVEGGVDLGRIETASGLDQPLWLILIFAFLGGLILNVMPCVLPVVSIKVIDLVSSAEKEPRTVISHGFVFAAGIVGTFLAGALAIIAIQAAGRKVGWGFQFQDPTFLIVMAAVIFVFGLSLADVFKLQAPSAVTAEGSGLAGQEGYGGSFFKGVVATLLGTPCVGPFLGPALGAAFILGASTTFSIFLAAGLGMAVPYLILLPFIVRMGRRERGQLSRRIQGLKGGLTDFKHFMSFLLFGTVVYLFYILNGVRGGYSVVWALALLTGLALAAWLWGRLVTIPRYGLIYALLAAIIVIVPTVWLTYPRIVSRQTQAGVTVAHEGWEEFSVAKLKEHTAQGRTVLVDFTADWCPNCKTNEAVALNIDSTRQLKEELGIVFMIADWTAPDEEIGDTLRALGFASVPLTAIFPGSNPNAPILIDGVYTPARLHNAMREAAGAE